jgi:hypothetical protein
MIDVSYFANCWAFSKINKKYPVASAVPAWRRPVSVAQCQAKLSIYLTSAETTIFCLQFLHCMTRTVCICNRAGCVTSTVVRLEQMTLSGPFFF